MKEFWFMLGAAVLIAAVGAAFMWGPPYLRDREAKRLVTSGDATVATVVSVSDTGNRYNDVPEIITTVLISPEGKAPYEAQYRHIGYPLPAGTMVTVYVDQENPLNIAIK